jgi:fructokinase
MGRVPGFRVNPVDTTGVGDAFIAGLLAGLLEQPDMPLTYERLHTMCRLGNAAGALATTRRGAIPAMPTRAAVKALTSEEAA